MSTKRVLTVVYPLVIATLVAVLMTSCAVPVVTPAPAGAPAEEAPAEDAKEVFLDVGEQPEITILINESPWYPGFEGVVELYEEQTGNVVNLDVVPYNGMLEKVRNSVRDVESPYDVVNINGLWLAEFYPGEFLAPIKEIDPEFELDPALWDYDETLYWNHDTNWFTKDGGVLYGIPTNSNITLFFYRGDLYEEAGLEPPDTWEDLFELCENEKLHNPPDLYCIVQRGERGNHIAFDSFPFVFAYGGGFWADPKNQDWTVTLNSPENKKGLDMYVDLATTYGPPDVGAITQGELIDYLVTGKAANAPVITAAWAAMDDPDRSAVVGDVQVKVIPGGEGGTRVSALGQWAAGIPDNLPDERKQAALAFLKWFLTYDAQYKYAEFGGVPVHQGVFESELGDEFEFRWMKAQADSRPYLLQTYPTQEAAEIEQVIGLRYNQALIGELSTAEALNAAAEEIHQIMMDAGKPKTGKLPDLPE